jgi:hypothetical protein
MNTHFGFYSLWQWALLAIPSQQHPLPVKSNQTIHGLPAGVRRESIFQLPAQGQSTTRAIRRRFALVVLIRQPSINPTRAWSRRGNRFHSRR